MRKDGAITVFLALTLTCIFSLMCGLLESARMAGARYYLSTAAGSALDSLFSQYHRELWNSYRVLFLECESPERMADEFQGYLTPYLETAGWYSMDLEKVEADHVLSAAGGGGRYLEKEILDYMRYGIWNIDMDTEHAAEFIENLREAGAVRDIAVSYGGHTKEAVRLEKSLEAVEKCLRAQKAHFEKAADYLDGHNAEKFFKEAEALKKEMSRLRGLVDQYEKQADSLGDHLSRTRKEFAQKRQDLSPDVSEALVREAAGYEEYTAKDGERRRQVRELLDAAERKREVIERTEEAAREVEEEIAEWEESHEEEDGDTLDEDALWNPVRRMFQAAAPPSLPFELGVKDEKTQGILEQLEQLADTGLLSLVLPEKAVVSEGIPDKADFPSGEAGWSGEMDSGLAEKLITNEYCVQFCTDFLSDEKKEVQYEMEYLLSGEDTDRENLTMAVKKILAVREGMNFLHILADGQKREEARALAGAIAGVTGFAPLVSVLSFFVMGVWALGEAIVDVRVMLEGGGAPFFKTRDTWSLSLRDLILLGQRGKEPDLRADKPGLTYTEYIKLLLLLEKSGKKYYRLMDIMQMNIRRKEPDFLVSRCAYSARVTATLWGRHLFLGLGPGRGPGEAPGSYPVKVTVEKAY